MSAIQIVCAVAVPLLWGYQFVAIKVGVTEFPPLFFLALRFLAIALLLIPFVKRPTRQQCGPLAAISVFLGGLNFGLFYVGLGLGSGSMSAVAFVGFGLWFWLIARCSMGRVAPFGLLLPVFAVISSVLFLGDRMTPKLIVGGLLAISGVAITQVRPSARPI